MRVFSTPKTLALASGLTLAFVTSFVPVSAFAQSSGSAKGGTGESKAITVDGVTVNSVQDRFNTSNQWMQVKVDITAKSNPAAGAVNPKWIPDVVVGLTLGWGKTGTPPQLDMAVAGTAKLVALELNTKTTVLFYLSPEFLQSASKNPNGFQAGNKPDFFVVDINAGGVAIEKSKTAVSTSLPNRNFVDGFLRAAQDQVTKNAGMMLTTDNVPWFILQAGAGNMGGAVIPALKAPVQGP
jgi:hypothetical protein